MKNFTRLLVLLLAATGGIFVFQAQDFLSKLSDGRDPNIDRPTIEAYMHFSATQQGQQRDAVTDATGFDNFPIGIDFCETNVVSSQQNPVWIFNSVNASTQNAYWTTNGGNNWTLNNPAYPSGTCCDPYATYTGSGVLIYASGVNGQYVYRSTNNGQTWTAPVLSVSGFDRNTISSEQTGNGPYANYSYATITGSGGAPVARSTDAGATWSTTATLAPHSVPGALTAVGPNGTTDGGCVIAVTSNGPAYGVTYYFHRSTDGGATWTQNISNLTVAGYSGNYNAASGRLNINFGRHRTYPFIAFDNSNGPYRGRLYLVYSSNIPAGQGNHPDIKIQWSTDLGVTWQPYVVVNNNANPEASDEWFPFLFVEPRTGKIYVKWYSDQENPATYQTGVWGSYSTDGGQTWAQNQRISNASFVYPCPSCGGSVCYRGDYDGITANTKVGFATWYDARNCNYQTMGGYFPDFAMKVNPPTVSQGGINDSSFVFCSVPAVKLYSDTAIFSATVQNPPGSGTITINFLNRTTNAPQTILTTFPDSLKMRIRTTGGVPNGTYTINVQANGPNGTPVHIRTVTMTAITGIENIGTEIPKSFYMYQNFPNPFNPTTKIRFDVAKTGFVKISVFDITGKKISDIVNGNFSAGKYQADFDGSTVSSGVYFYKIETPDYTNIRKMVLVK